jgi:hypothetical protein
MSTTTPVLSTFANREIFQIPHGPIGDIVCKFRLEWMWNTRENFVQPLIQADGVYAAGFRPATKEEIETYSPTPYKDRYGYGSKLNN